MHPLEQEQDQIGGKSGSQERLINMEPIKVYCRIRPSSGTCKSCISVIPPDQIHIEQQAIKGRLTRYSFKQVFTEKTSQSSVFDNVAMPLLKSLIAGRNSLLFTYGVTGSGKTFTMTGSKEDPGIIPRSIDVIFNSIAEHKAKKFIFKCDKLNGFEVQPEEDACLDRHKVILSHPMLVKNSKFKLEKKDSDPDLLWLSRDPTKIDTLNDDNLFAIFITFVEIYNNNVYDLLEDLQSDSTRPSQSKIVREDSVHNMYVHGVTEVEVSSPEEAFEVYFRGSKKKRVGQTALNAESSRAHTVFTIRLVQAPTDENGETMLTDKNIITVSQISLVDLAGSERCLRTNISGQRLREAGNINNSLMTLRTCLEYLKENQNGGNKMIPYRESRLTHLFKKYFEGEGQVSMIICVSPSSKDLDETLHVLKFAEMSQEIKMTCTPVHVNTPLRPGRRKANQAYLEALKEFQVNAIVETEPVKKEESVICAMESGDTAYTPSDLESEEQVNILFPSDICSNLPLVGAIQKDDDESLKKAVLYHEHSLEMFNNFINDLNKRYVCFRDVLLKSERKTFMATQEMKSINSLYEVEKNKAYELETRVNTVNSEMNGMKRKMDDNELSIKRLKCELSAKESELVKRKIEFENKIDMFRNKKKEAEDKLRNELELKLQSQKTAVEYELKTKNQKLTEVRRIIDDDLTAAPWVGLSDGGSSFSVVNGGNDRKNHYSTPRVQPIQLQCRTTVRKLGPAVANKRYRRSKSADVWLDHRPSAAVPLSTVMQPKMKKRKSITKLTQSKDITEKASKYCLMTQGQDSDGDIETRLYKGDVIPTAGGGAQVMFNDIEVLRQISPRADSPKTPRHW